MDNTIDATRYAVVMTRYSGTAIAAGTNGERTIIARFSVLGDARAHVQRETELEATYSAERTRRAEYQFSIELLEA